MMTVKKTIPYKLRTGIPALMLAGATLFGGCNKEDIEKHDVDLPWSCGYYEQITSANVQRHLDDPSVGNVYLHLYQVDPDYASKEWTKWTAEDIHHKLYGRTLAPLVGKDPNRVFGRGNFEFARGVCPRADSLWFTQHGWTVNQNQR
ncbi:MAG TPA: hypothetical protein DEA31_03665 [Alphaproteobacteria bacterium]|nr:hypothetical protein [Alphaproteobacteria bacterium]